MKKLKFGSKAYREKYLGHHSKKNKSKSRRVKHMSKKKHSPKQNKMARPLMVALSTGVGLAYGAFRNDIASKLPDIPKMENYSDEIILGGVATAGQLLTGNKWVNAVLRPISDIEVGRAGAKIRAKIPLGNGTGGQGQSVQDASVWN